MLGRADSPSGSLESSTLFSRLSRLSSARRLPLYSFGSAVILNADGGHILGVGLLRDPAPFLNWGCSICAR